MNTDKDKNKATDDKDSNRPQEKEQDQPVHFERTAETYGNEETLEDEAAAEQQRKEALTERD